LWQIKAKRCKYWFIYTFRQSGLGCRPRSCPTCRICESAVGASPRGCRID